MLINDITYNWGNTGDDPINTLIGSSLDFTIAGELGAFNEFLVGGNRTWKVVLNEGQGISDNANTALSQVSADFFISFEQDLLIAWDWWSNLECDLPINPEVSSVYNDM